MASSQKICTLGRLLALREEARRAGRVVVHCHGCFDIVHPGHIHHLQYARTLGDVLIVSVSADSQVNKGLGRPLIPDDLRAASLAALECVDWVYVNPDATAVELLDVLRPDVYVKGREYEQNRDPRFLAERETVTGHGGRVVFSSGDVIFSSTALIGNLDHTDAFNAEKVWRFRERYGVTQSAVKETIAAMSGRRIVVIGDYILDRYHFCEAAGVASEAPVMALRSLRHRDYDGGAAVIALHLAGLGCAPVLVSDLAGDELSNQVRLRLQSAGVAVDALTHRRQVALKHRYLVDSQKMLKVDEGAQTPLDSTSEQLLAERIMALADGAAAVIFADFGYGLITTGLLHRITRPLRDQVPVMTATVSGKQSSLLRFWGLDLICATEHEVRECLHDFSSGLTAVACSLIASTASRNAIVTLGKQGLMVCDQHRPGQTNEPWERRLRSEYIPALTSQGVDPLGCGDALLATASAALVAGGSVQAAGFLGSVAAAVHAQQLGNPPLSAELILGRIGERAETPVATRLAS